LDEGGIRFKNWEKYIPTPDIPPSQAKVSIPIFINPPNRSSHYNINRRIKTAEKKY
jgi:hypothetical protein